MIGVGDGENRLALARAGCGVVARDVGHRVGDEVRLVEELRAFDGDGAEAERRRLGAGQGRAQDDGFGELGRRGFAVLEARAGGVAGVAGVAAPGKVVGPVGVVDGDCGGQAVEAGPGGGGEETARDFELGVGGFAGGIDGRLAGGEAVARGVLLTFVGRFRQVGDQLGGGVARGLLELKRGFAAGDAVRERIVDAVDRRVDGVAPGKLRALQGGEVEQLGHDQRFGVGRSKDVDVAEAGGGGSARVVDEAANGGLALFGLGLGDEELGLFGVVGEFGGLHEFGRGRVVDRRGETGGGVIEDGHRDIDFEVGADAVLQPFAQRLAAQREVDGVVVDGVEIDGRDDARGVDEGAGALDVGVRGQVFDVFDGPGLAEHGGDVGDVGDLEGSVVDRFDCGVVVGLDFGEGDGEVARGVDLREQRRSGREVEGRRGLFEAGGAVDGPGAQLLEVGEAGLAGRAKHLLDGVVERGDGDERVALFVGDREFRGVLANVEVVGRLADAFGVGGERDVVGGLDVAAQFRPVARGEGGVVASEGLGGRRPASPGRGPWARRSAAGRGWRECCPR